MNTAGLGKSAKEEAEKMWRRRKCSEWCNLGLKWDMSNLTDIPWLPPFCAAADGPSNTVQSMSKIKTTRSSSCQPFKSGPLS
jgi:hypothetical protein